MAAVKLRFLALAIDTGRVLLEAARRAGPMLLLPFGLIMLLQWIGPGPAAGGMPATLASLLREAGAALAGWMMLLIVARASLGGRSGPDLLRPDRLACMLLGLQFCDMIATDLILAPDRGWRTLAVLAGLIYQIAWIRLTLLLGVSGALGVSMSPSRSWSGLRGNFLRILVFGFVWMLLAVAAALACAYGVSGHLRLPQPATGSITWGVLSGLSTMITTAVPCAIYRRLAGTPAPSLAGESLAA